MIFSSLASKPTVTVFSSLASKLVAMVSPGLASKSGVSLLFEPQNQGGGGFSSLGIKIGSSDLVICASKSSRRFFGLGLKTKWALIYWLRHKTDGREIGMGLTSRSSGLLGVEASLARISQFGLKTGGGATTGGARGTIAEDVSEAS
jgi:hypothetical protein